MGFGEFFKDAWNAIDVVTILFSIITIGLWAARFVTIVIRFDSSSTFRFPFSHISLLAGLS